jgi:hypothetical protein
MRPNWSELVSRVFMIGLIAGFPIALTLAWYHGRCGLKRINAGEVTIISVLVLISTGPSLGGIGPVTLFQRMRSGASCATISPSRGVTISGPAGTL